MFMCCLCVDYRIPARGQRFRHQLGLGQLSPDSSGIPGRATGGVIAKLMFIANPGAETRCAISISLAITPPMDDACASEGFGECVQRAHGAPGGAHWEQITITISLPFS